MQYTFGALFAAVYVLTALFLPWITLGWGAGLGVALWLGGDGLVAPLLGASPWPNRVPRHVLGINLTTHLIYGLVVETVRVLLYA